MAEEHVEAQDQAQEQVEVVEELPQELKDIKAVLSQAHTQCCLFKGIRQCLKQLENDHILYLFLADDCDEEDYKKLLTALCKEKNVKIVKVPEKAKLAEWSFQAKVNAEGKIVKSTKCSCAVVGKRIRMSDDLKRLQAKLDA
ncbi:40S ribosomal protein S12, putative [Entamoeba invadens IP1]|uniref:40S ribosomal protein S12, putative n=1 Tax=Entamoeba invadens IP1 TaxID=370355 RepID=A0A0A1UGE1_ENTIV|nr:40S ribosomal protein S12, putative [Entamoeba invadens IP1]ELP92591.1 40S ribosomal protein S12, putative [Entamoeba invadens IP1]|eukprot:XP_004259362.1 40S ribosomal protein S12, putative [Entamoeba invadens IP1]